MTFEEKQTISRQISRIQNRLDHLSKHGPRSHVIHDDDVDAIIDSLEKLREIAKIELVGYDPKTNTFTDV